MTVKELKDALSQYDERDIIVVEIHEGVRYENLYGFGIDSVELLMEDGTTINEIRLTI